MRSALGRILAEDVISPLNVPSHNNSAMDGYALNATDLAADSLRDFDVIGCAYAGRPFAEECHTGQCVRIMTGAMIPVGAVTVAMQEQVKQLSDNKVQIDKSHQRGKNIRLAGEDITKGCAVLEAGRCLLPADLGVLASLGIGEVQVRGRPLTFGHLGDAIFFGLPGNPVAVMVTFYQFVQPALHYLLSDEIHMPLTLQATSMTKMRKRPGRFEFLRGILSQPRQGHFEVRMAGRQGSGILTSMSHANCFILLAEETGDIKEGDSVMIQPFETFE